MKTTILCWVFVLTAGTLFAQQSPTISEADFLSQTQVLFGQELATCIDKKDYKGALAALDKAFALYQCLPDKLQKEYAHGLQVIYYNQANCHALLKQKKQALEALTKAVEAGYDNYNQIKTNVDLDYLRKDKRFIALIDIVRERGDYLYVLQQAAPYTQADTTGLPRFTYQKAKTSTLQQVKTIFKLDSVAGKGDEVSQILNVLKYVHNLIRHDGSNSAYCEPDAIDLYNYHRSTGKGLNCRHLAITLVECYLSMGLQARYVTCMPKDSKDQDCHVICTVYSKTLQKWLWVDPTFNAYVKDENNNLLSIAEVRERLIADRPLVLNEDANWNNQNKQTKEYYLDTYMAKNLYWIGCNTANRFNPESLYRPMNNIFVALTPTGFVPENATSYTVLTDNADYFWQKPE